MKLLIAILLTLAVVLASTVFTFPLFLLLSVYINPWLVIPGVISLTVHLFTVNILIKLVGVMK